MASITIPRGKKTVFDQVSATVRVPLWSARWCMRQAHAAIQARLEAGRAELEAAGLQLMELRTQFLSELERVREQVTLAQDAALTERLTTAEPSAPRPKRRWRRRMNRAKSRAKDETCRRYPATRMTATIATATMTTKTERAAAIHWIQDKMAGYDLAMGELEAAGC